MGRLMLDLTIAVAAALLNTLIAAPVYAAWQAAGYPTLKEM